MFPSSSYQFHMLPVTIQVITVKLKCKHRLRIVVALLFYIVHEITKFLISQMSVIIVSLDPSLNGANVLPASEVPTKSTLIIVIIAC
jgi:hypothetical protein